MPKEFPPVAFYFDTKHPDFTIMAQALAGRPYEVDTVQPSTITVKSGVSTDGTFNMGPGDDVVVIQSGVTGHINFNYANNDGHDLISGFSVALDKIAISGFTQQQVSLSSHNGNDVLSFGNTSVELVGIHDSLSQLIAEHAVVFA